MMKEICRSVELPKL